MDPKNEAIPVVEVIERYLILLLGVVEKPIPSSVHVQKELFILSKANPRIAEFITFEKHYKGPYSADLADISKEPAYYSSAFGSDQYGRLYLTPKGKEAYKKIIDTNTNNSRFQELLSMIKLTRELYDKLSKNELMFLVYATYDEYTEKSNISKNLLAPTSRKKFTRVLLDKGLISEERARELLVGA
jgi:uncharacterized protein YwgA